MKKAMNYLLLGFVTILIILYALAWSDLIGNKRLTGNIFKDVGKSFTYFIGWLPYWWLIILIGSVLLGAIFYGIKIGLNKFKKIS